jgi:hypothetical protein
VTDVPLAMSNTGQIVAIAIVLVFLIILFVVVLQRARRG